MKVNNVMTVHKTLQPKYKIPLVTLHHTRYYVSIGNGKAFSSGTTLEDAKAFIDRFRGSKRFDEIEGIVEVCPTGQRLIPIQEIVSTDNSMINTKEIFQEPEEQISKSSNK